MIKSKLSLIILFLLGGIMGIGFWNYWWHPCPTCPVCPQPFALVPIDASKANEYFRTFVALATTEEKYVSAVNLDFQDIETLNELKKVAESQGVRIYSGRVGGSPEIFGMAIATKKVNGLWVEIPTSRIYQIQKFSPCPTLCDLNSQIVKGVAIPNHITISTKGDEKE